MSTPAISVIVPVYNSEKYLRECIDSILTQTYTDFELLLVDDGSPDGSGAICDEYAAKDDRVRVFHKQNGGVSSARNLGLDLSLGEWILFADSDDTIPIDALENMIAPTLDNQDIGFVMGGYTVYDEEGNVTHNCNEQIHEELFSADIIRYLYQPKYYRYWGYICSKLYRLSIVREYGIHFDESIFFNEDRLFCVEYLSHIHNKAILLTTSCYNYIEHLSGAMGTLNTGYNRRFVTDLDAFVKMKQIIKGIPDNRPLLILANEGICNSYYRNVNMMLQHKAYDSSIHRHLLKKIVYSGTIVYYLKAYILRPIFMLLYPKLYMEK